MQPDLRQQLSDLLPRMGRFAAVLTRSSRDAEDLVQASCERVLSRATQWTQDTRFDSWVFRIMQSIWFNELRSRRVRARFQLDIARSPDDGPREDGERVVFGRITLERVERAIFELSEKERLILLLVCVECLSYREAAEVVGIPIGTVMSRLSRARLHLIEALEAPRPTSLDNVRQLTRCRS